MLLCAQLKKLTHNVDSMFVYLSAELILIKFDIASSDKKNRETILVFKKIYIKEVWATFLREEMVQLELPKISKSK
jgi:hypothetical protein